MTRITMKNLLIPTDFSDCAGEALKAGMQLARRFGSKVHLLHLIESAPGTSGSESVEQRLTRGGLEPLLENYPDVPSVAVCVAGGLLRERISSYVAGHGIDLIVMGSHGVGGKSEYFIGSQTQKVVRTVRCSVLVIKSAPEDLNFDKVIFASSFNENEKEAFLHFKEIVKHFIPEIHLVAIHTSALFEPPYTVTREAMEDFKALCHPFNCKMHIYKDFTIDRGIRASAVDLGAKLIAISNHNRHPVKRMLTGSNVEALVNHADVPVLSIDYREDKG